MDCLAKSPVVFALYLDLKSEVWERCEHHLQKESYTDKRHYTITDALGHRDLITYSKEESYTYKRHYTITDTLGLRDIVKSTITDASQANARVKQE